MSIFESLENLNVSEECFDSIVNLLEKHLSQEDKAKYDKAYKIMMSKFRRDHYEETKDPKYSLDHEHGQKVFDYIKKRRENLKYDPNSGKRQEKALFRTN